MKALIIAAGDGTRLGPLTVSRPKALVKLLGLTLIERVILGAREAGIEEFVIVVGYMGGKVKKALGDGSRYGVRIRYVESLDWERGNGLSVLAARPYLRERFLLLMADHVFDPGMLKLFLERSPWDEGVTLAVDERVDGNELVELEDATKVFFQDRRILDIGKGVERYNGFDTGIFLCTPLLFDALEESVRAGDSTLSGAIRLLASRGRAMAEPVRGRWVDVDDEKTLKKAERMLLRGLSKKTDGPVSRHLNRPISKRLTKRLVGFGVKPAHLSLASFLLAVLGAILFFLAGAKRSYLLFLTGGSLAQISSILDGCDGEVARLLYQTSELGGWLDSVLDRYADAFLILGLTYYSLSHANPGFSISLGFLALIGSFMNSYTAIKYDLLAKHLGEGFRFGRDIRMLIIFLGALANMPLPTLAILALLTNTENIRRMGVFYRTEGSSA